MLAIYKILNLKTKKFYIGSTINFSIRKINHLSSLRRNASNCTKLQNAFNKYGEDSFSFEILEEVSGESLLIQREQYYLDTLKPAYNIRKIADRNSGVRKTQKTIEKMVLSSKKQQKPVTQYTFTRKIVKEWESLNAASRGTGISVGGIKRCCYGTQKSSGGFRFSYKGKKLAFHSKKAKYKTKEGRDNSWELFRTTPTFEIQHPNGKIEITDNLAKYCRDNNLSYFSAQKICYGDCKQTREGYKFRILNKPPKKEWISDKDFKNLCEKYNNCWGKIGKILGRSDCTVKYHARKLGLLT